MKNDWQKGIEVSKKGGVVVLPTDTLYGIVASAMSKKAVERIYEVKGRKENKPFIVVINSYKQLEIFGIKISKERAKIFSKFWPGKVSVILPCQSNKWGYIHRGTNSIAFRMIGSRNKNLFNFIKKVGPIVAPSANPEGEKPAETIKEAKDYFLHRQDLCIHRSCLCEIQPELYINGGLKKSLPSTLIRFNGKEVEILRQGAKKIKN